MDTIYALSSGAPPAGIGIIRITGPLAFDALAAVAGKLPKPRRAMRAQFCDAAGQVLDDGLALIFPAPFTATGEDLAELHCHGGRAVIAALEASLAAMPGLRQAQAGEFTRRAFANGRIDLAEAEGLADLLAAETELQRRAAMAMAGGLLSARVAEWRELTLGFSAQVEASLDFSDEDDVEGLPADLIQKIADLHVSISAALAAPHAELLRNGFRVALAGPPNAGKSTLFNALVESEAAITAPTAGTTRDVLIQPVALAGIPFSFVDMAGLREPDGDAVEAIGISRAKQEIMRADLILWLGPETEGPAGAWEIDAQCDRLDRVRKTSPLHRLSALTGEGMDGLRFALIDHARQAMPAPDALALNLRQRSLLQEVVLGLEDAQRVSDPLLLAENLRTSRHAFDRLLGNASTENVLDAVFGRFCIGK